MKIKVSNADHGLSFVVEAETNQEKVLLQIISSRYCTGEFDFHVGGFSRTTGTSPGYHSMNFGWVKKKNDGQ